MFWSLFEESKSGIFYELQLLDTTILFGQVNIFTKLLFTCLFVIN